MSSGHYRMPSPLTILRFEPAIYEKNIPRKPNDFHYPIGRISRVEVTVAGPENNEDSEAIDSIHRLLEKCRRRRQEEEAPNVNTSSNS